MTSSSRPAHTIPGSVPETRSRRAVLGAAALTAAGALALPAAAHAAPAGRGHGDGHGGGHGHGPGRGHGPGHGHGHGTRGRFLTEDLATGGDGVFPNYRIPALVQLNNGDILAAYDGRPTGTDSPGPNSVLQRRSTDGGVTWGEQTVIEQGKEGEEKEGYSDPSYVYDRITGTLFNFHVFSKDTGFFDSGYGNDDADRRVQSTTVSVSTDDGRTWTSKRLTKVTKPEDVRGMFATSGAGIQLTRGRHRGRLVQQYIGQWRDESFRSYSVYSDDHGRTWTMGEPVGIAMDENKVVELSDGTLMLNSRIHAGGTARFVALSRDGGESWSEPVLDATLTDPRNNASVIAMNPGARKRSAKAKELLFSNSNSANERVNGSIRYSYDDGETWPVVKSYQAGDHAYSQLAALEDGTFGVLFEGEDSNQIVFGRFDRAWLNPFRLHVRTTRATVDAGGSVELRVRIRNDDERALPAGTASASLPTGWEAESVHLPALRPGHSASLRLSVSAPADVDPGTVLGDVTVEAGDFSLRGDLVVSVRG
ncbi:exo-alpha-sialidase [Brachybacterium endophyticum]|uniref:exo-alpha-sialidase n=1 Tax=Brachybacterium endophyticum TaxID=2182385 RepID=UPI0014040594|nr:exo-alpha-sialidase [Brachybacterium endophyticum]